MKTLNLWRTLLFTVAAVAAFSACSDDKEDGGSANAKITVQVGEAAAGTSATVIKDLTAGLTEAVTVESTGTWTLTFNTPADESWCTPSAKSGKSGKLTFELGAATANRSTTVTLTTMGVVAGVEFPVKATITIKQQAAGTVVGAITIPELVAMVKALGGEKYKVIDADNDRYVDGVVMNNFEGGNYSYNNLILATEGSQEAGNGITFAFVIPNEELGLTTTNQKVRIKLLKGVAQVSTFNGLYQVTGPKDTKYCEVESKGDVATVTPVVITPDKLADYQGMAVTINNATNATAGIWGNTTGISIHTFSANSTDFTVFVKKVDATSPFNNAALKAATGNISGLASVNSNKGQLVPRSLADVTAFGGAPSTDPLITLNPASLSFTAEGETKEIAVTAVNAEGATLEVASDNAQFTPVATGLTKIAVTAKANTGAAVSATLTVKLMKGGAAVDTKTVALSQAAPLAGGEAVLEVVMKEYPTYAAVGTSSMEAGTVSVAPFSLAFAKGTNTSNPPKYYGNAGFEAVRMYAANSLTITGGTITKIEFTLAAPYQGANYNNLLTTTGALTSSSDTEQTWTGEASEIVFTTNPDKVDGKNLQSRISSMKITYKK